MTETAPDLPEVPAAEAFARSARAEAVIVDVREPDEWKAGHIAGALHIPLGELGTRLAELPQSDPVIAVCRSGNRSAAATRALRGAGIDAANLSGGMEAWTSADLPLQAPDTRGA